MSLITVKQLTRTYDEHSIPVYGLRAANFEIEQGAFSAFVGPSGLGKSTLPNLLGCLDQSTSGKMDENRNKFCVNCIMQCAPYNL